MRMQLAVPFISQYDAQIEPDWQDRACGVVALKMVMDFHSAADIPAVQDLITEGQLIGAYAKGVGWIHDGLAALARNHGFDAYRQEWRSVFVDIISKVMRESPYQERLLANGIRKLVDTLSAGSPVIVSIRSQFREDGGSHLAVLTGFEKNADGEVTAFSYHEPAEEDSTAGSHRSVDLATFKKYWNKRAIFVG